MRSGHAPSPRTPGPAGPRGTPLAFTRQATSRKLLKTKWDIPKVLDAAVQKGPTVVKARMSALPREDAIRRLAGDDPRPLLVMRECETCKGSDVALLSQKLNNERTLLLTQWFHCVKLRPNVLEKTHTFHELFGERQPPHLFMMTAKGENYLPFDGTQTQTQLWKGMSKVLRSVYPKDPSQAVRKIFALMAKYDHLDSMASQHREKIEVLEEEGSTSKLAKERAKLAKILAQKERVKAAEKKAFDLGPIAKTPKLGHQAAKGRRKAD